MGAAAASGCIGLAFGIESGSPEILKAVHKPGTVASFRRAKELLKPYPHVFVRGFLIMGFPHETVRQLLQTMELALDLDFDWYPVQLLNPLPSTEIYTTMMEQGLIEDVLRVGTNVAIGPAGTIHLHQEREKLTAPEFLNLFGERDPDELLQQKDLPDWWFLMNYKLNFEKIHRWSDGIKLEMQRGMLCYICDRVAQDIGHPLASMYLAMCEEKLGNGAEAHRRLADARQALSESQYWQRRFETLGLYSVMDELTVLLT